MGKVDELLGGSLVINSIESKVRLGKFENPQTASSGITGAMEDGFVVMGDRDGVGGEDCLTAMIAE